MSRIFSAEIFKHDIYSMDSLNHASEQKTKESFDVHYSAEKYYLSIFLFEIERIKQNYECHNMKEALARFAQENVEMSNEIKELEDSLSSYKKWIFVSLTSLLTVTSVMVFNVI
jgi:U3 small nucleolar ribonucleoprotein component